MSFESQNAIVIIILFYFFISVLRPVKFFSLTNGLNWPKIKLVRDIMIVFVTCKFDKDSIKNEGATLETTSSPL